jgi:hypothetical protein
MASGRSSEMVRAPRGLVARLGLTLLTLAGAVWLALVAARAGSIALGLTPAHDFARGLAAFMLAPRPRPLPRPSSMRAWRCCAAATVTPPGRGS